eukprot:35703-Prorocentrum_minimum.AAC.2
MGGTTEFQLALFGGLSLEEIKTRKQQAEEKRLRLREQIQSPDTPIEQKHHLQTVLHMETTRGLMLCPSCWLLPAYCCCTKWHRVGTRHRVCIYMHHNEW